MKRMVRQRIAVLLCMAMVLSMVDPGAGIRSLADTRDGQAAYSTQGTYVNPVYADTPAAKAEAASMTEMESSLDGKYCGSIQEAGSVLRQAMVNRDESLEIYLTFVRESPDTDPAILDAKAARLTDQIVAEALKHTGGAKEGDYLSMQYSSIDYQICFALGDGDYTKGTFKPRFTTTKEEEQRLDAEVARIKAELNLSEKSDYEKIKSIYDWVITNVRYDYEAQPGENMYVYSPYGAIVNKSCVCQGYAMGLTRLLIDAGLDSRVVTGYGGKPFTYGNSHAWNIVKLEGKYYYLDPTWEAGKDAEETGYLYFLHGSSDWINHFPSDESLLKSYNISFENYEKEQQTVHGGSNIPNGAFSVYVVDVNGEPIPDAVVTMPTFSGRTDQNGFAVFTLSSDMGENRIGAKKEGYSEGWTTADIAAGSTCTISLNTNPEELVIEVAASYGGKTTDLLSNYLHFNEYAEDPDRDTSRDKESVLTLNIRTHPELTGLSYEIWSGDSLVARSGDSSMDFTVYECAGDENADYVYSSLKDFKAGQDVGLRIYQNGRQIAGKFLGLQIGEPETYINGSSKKGVAVPVGYTAKTPKGIPFLENIQLTIGGDLNENLELRVEIEKNKVRVGLNLKDDFMKKDGSNKQAYYDAVEEMKSLEGINIKDLKKLNEFKESKLKQLNKIIDKKNVKCGQAMLQGEATCFGYGEGVCTDEGLYEISVNIHLLININGSLTYQTFVVGVPVYVRGEGSASTGVKGGMGVSIASKPSVSIADTSFNLVIPLEIELKLSAGVGWYSIISGGGGGSLKLDSEYASLTAHAKADLIGSIFAEFYITPWYHHTYNFVERTWPLYDGIVGGGTAGAQSLDADSAFGDYDDLDQYEPVSLSSMDSYGSSGALGDLILDDKIVRGNTPRLVENSKGEVFAFYFAGQEESLDGSGLVVVQITKDGEGNDQVSAPVRVAEAETIESAIDNSEALAGNGSSSARRRADEGGVPAATPSNAQASPSDAAAADSAVRSRSTKSLAATDGKMRNADISGTADFYYDVCENGDIIYIAVSKAKRSLEGVPADSAEEITEILKTSEICLYCLDTQAKQMSFVRQLTDDDTVDVSPRIYLDDKGIHVAWLSIEPGAGGLFGDDASYTVNLYDEKDGTIKKEEAGSSRVSELAIGKLGGKVTVVYSADTDGDNATAEDVELFAYDGERSTRMTDNKVADNAPQFYHDGTKLMWNQNGAIYETSGVNGGSEVIDAGVSVASGFRIIEGVNVYLAWEEVDPADNRVSVHMIQKKGDGWGDRFMVYQDEDYVTSPVDGYVNNDGLNLLHINTDNVFDRGNAGSALIFSRNLVRTDLSVEAVAFDAEDVEIGKKLPISVYVKNNGNTVIKEITLGVDDEELKTVSATLDPGEEKELKFNEFVVPEMEGETEFTVFAQASSVEGGGDAGNLSRAADEAGDSGTLELGYTDLAVDMNLEIINELNYLTVSVTNNSYMPSRASLRMQANSDMGMVLKEELLDEIPAKTTRIRKYRLDDVENGFAVQSIAAVVVPEVPETMTENNSSLVYVEGVNERYRLNVEVSEGGTVNQPSGAYTGSETFDLKATPFEGYRFVRWECSLEGSVENDHYPETRFHMPRCDVTVKAVFQNLKDWKVQSITVLPGGISMNVGQSSILGLEILPEDAGDKSVTWHSTNPGVATVDADGKVTGVARGTADIYCISNDGGNVESNHCVVTINRSGGSGGGGGGGGSSSGGGGGSGKSSGSSGGPTTPTVLKDTYENSSWAQNADGTWKLLKEDGTPAAGWAVKSNAWYYMDPASQLMTTGWIFVDNVWYYMAPASGAMQTGWTLVDNVWYYLNPTSGAMQTGWVSVNNVWYYLSPAGGAMQTGWILVDSAWYYMDPASGAMATGWKEINAKQYYFEQDGKLAVSTKTPDGSEVNENGEKIG